VAEMVWYAEPFFFFLAPPSEQANIIINIINTNENVSKYTI
jgi:hypothetical protein